jgi:hypothetical protein
MNDPIPAPVHELLTLFTAELGDVRFPDVDASVLATAAASVHAAAEVVARAEADLAAARAALASSQDELLGCAQRAHAYAQVFAAESPELVARLAAIALPKARRPKVVDDAAPPRRRGRPPKVREVLQVSEPSQAAE